MQVRWPLLALLGQSTASWAPTYVLRVPPRGVIHAVHRRCSKPPVAHLGAMPDQLEYERNAALNECTHLRAEVAAAREAHRTAVSEAKVRRARRRAWGNRLGRSKGSVQHMPSKTVSASHVDATRTRLPLSHRRMRPVSRLHW
jgi:hypothetical protein